MMTAATAEVQEVLVGISRRTLQGRILVESMRRVPDFKAFDSRTIVEGLGMLMWLVGHQVGVLATIKDAMVTMTVVGN